MEEGEGEIEEIYESDMLPNDTIFYIFEFCDIQDITKMISVSKSWTWSQVAKSDQVWKKRFSEALEKSLVKDEKDRMEEIEIQEAFFKKYAMLRNHEKDFKNRHFITYIPSTVKPLKKKNKYNTRLVKLVVIGDHSIGKTSLLVSHTTGSFPDGYIPTVFDNYNATVLHKEEHISLGLWDTAGHEDYDRLRPLSYPETHIFLLCFSVVDHTSYKNITERWVEEIRYHRPEAAIAVCATKIDLRKDSCTLESLSKKELEPIRYEEGYRVAESIGAAAYFETSAKEQIGLKECFEGCVSVALGDYVARDMSLYDDSKKKKSGRSGCNIM